MGIKNTTKILTLVGLVALLVQCSKHSSSANLAAIAPGQTAANSCPSFAVPCSVTHGSGTESCANSDSGPVYGACQNIICDTGFAYNSNSNICVGAEVSSSFAMLVSGTNLAPTGASSFIAQIGQNYDFKITGSNDVVSAGINSAQSYAKYISGQCAGSSYTFQPLTTDFTPSGASFQFGDNAVAYTIALANTLGGCIWQVCAVSNNSVVPAACVNMIASVDPLPTTTTTTTLPPTTTTTTTLPKPTTTTTTLPPTTTTTTTTLPGSQPIVTGKTCVGPINASYNCHSFASGGSASANHLKNDPGCNAQATITYKGQSANASVFTTGAPYNAGGGMGQGNTNVTIQGVIFHVYVEDEYFINPTGNFVGCSALVSWPNFPNPPKAP